MDIYITLYKTVGRTVKYKSVIEKKKNQNQNQKQNDETNWQKPNSMYVECVYILNVRLLSLPCCNGFQEQRKW